MSARSLEAIAVEALLAAGKEAPAASIRVVQMGEKAKLNMTCTLQMLGQDAPRPSDSISAPRVVKKKPSPLDFENESLPAGSKLRHLVPPGRRPDIRRSWVRQPGAPPRVRDASFAERAPEHRRRLIGAWRDPHGSGGSTAPSACCNCCSSSRRRWWGLARRCEELREELADLESSDA